MGAPMTRSTLALARKALDVAQEALPTYSFDRARKDYTQHQLFAILVVRQFFHLDYRDVQQLLKDWSDLRQVLGLKKVPHYTTLQKAHARLLKKGLWSDCSTSLRPSPKSRG